MGDLRNLGGGRSAHGATSVRTLRRRVPAPRGGSSRIPTILVDDHTLIRQGVRALLGDEPDIEVVGEAADGRQAVVATLRLRPRVVVMDIAMPLLNGIEATRQILAAVPETRVLILSAHNDAEYVARVLGLGAAGYVLKQSSLDELAAAIRVAAAGGRFVSPEIPYRRRGGAAGGEIGPAPAPARAGKRPRSSTTQLTGRETEVLQLVAEGHANKQMAIHLGITIKTVEKHRASLMAKLDIHDVAGLTRHAIAIGTIEGRGRGPSF